MEPTKISGLPAHVLLVHLVIAAVPIASLVVIVCALWPAARRRVGIILPIIVLGALITGSRAPTELSGHSASGVRFSCWMRTG